jgi:hypothetical protein
MSGRTRFIAGIVVAAVLGVAFIGFAILGFIGAVISGNGIDWTGVLGALVIMGLGVACALWAVHLEHRLRGLPAGKIALIPGPSRSGPPSWQTARRRRNGPVARAIFLGLWTTATVILVVTALHLHSQAGRSSYVQAHGAQRTAVVTGVDNIEHQGKYSTWYTAQIDATFIPPVSGQAKTDIYVPDQVDYSIGQRLPVLVDPKEPGYAELPGTPNITSSNWITGVVVAVIMIVFEGLTILATIRDYRRRHAWTATYPAPQPVAS